MVDDIKDYSVWMLGIAMATVELFSGYRRMSATKKVLLVVCVVLLTYLGIDQINRKSSSDQKFNSRIDSLNSGIERLQQSKTNDSLKAFNDSVRDEEFQKELFHEFQITRDSARNMPVKNEFNTRIEKAENVHIGPN